MIQDDHQLDKFEETRLTETMLTAEPTRTLLATFVSSNDEVLENLTSSFASSSVLRMAILCKEREIKPSRLRDESDR